jgi:homoserine dehydrogenase
VREVTLVQIGIGTVGGAVVQQIIGNRDLWRTIFDVDVKIGTIVTTAGAIVSQLGGSIPDDVARELVAARRVARVPAALTDANLDVINPAAAIERLTDQGQVVVVDTGAGDEVAPLLAAALQQGAGVVLANKAPLALPWDDDAGSVLWNHAGPRGHLRYEATCGAGLPVIATLRTLLDVGDVVTEIQGALSGTLGAIFSDVAKGARFGEAVRTAKERGYTEPDPRDDLSGLDVARKALILARTIGRTDNLTDIRIESLVPSDLAGKDIDVPTFLDRISDLDDAMARRAAEANAAGATLKYIARVRPEGEIEVGVQPVSVASVLGALQGPENIVTFRTTLYDQYPLAISGPGAGAGVTAAGVISDILAVVRDLEG